MNLRKFSCRFSTFSAAIVAAVALTSAARAQHGDVWLSHDVPSDKLVVGVVDEAGTTFTPGVRVFEAILTPDTFPFSPFDYSAEDPGFLSAAGDLPPNEPIALTLASLQVWNGSGLDPAVGVDFAFDLGGGFSTEADGSIHEHPLFGLIDLTLDPAPLPNGAYVAAFTASMTGVDASELIYFVILKDDLIEDETDVETVEGLLEDYENGGPEPVFMGKNFAFFEEAVEFVEAIPEPSGMALAGCCAVGLALARRRK
jgi:hypothetical protein